MELLPPEECPYTIKPRSFILEKYAVAEFAMSLTTDSLGPYHYQLVGQGFFVKAGEGTGLSIGNASETDGVTAATGTP